MVSALLQLLDIIFMWADQLLTIHEKNDNLDQLEQKTSYTEQYGIGKPTVYNIKKKEEEI